MSEKQELFNESLAHIRKQGEPAFENDQCFYNDPDGVSKLQCAAAIFIKSDAPDYVQEFEGSWGTLSVAHPYWLDPRAIRHTILVARLQDCHDNSALVLCGRRDNLTGIDEPDFLTVYEHQMRELAVKDGLEYSAP
jgi:hypothetical protein